MMYFFRSKLVVFSRKFSKTVTGADRHKMAEISAPCNNTRTSLTKSAKESTVFSNWYICVRGTGKLFKSKTRIVYLTGNARHELKITNISLFKNLILDQFFKKHFSHAV